MKKKSKLDNDSLSGCRPVRTGFWQYLRIVTLILFFPFVCHAQSQPVPDVEYQALVDFYNALNGSNWSSSYKWDINQNDLSTRAWAGVTVANGHVTGLSMSFGTNVTGAIPASFGNLKYLKTLLLSNGSYTCNLSATNLDIFANLDSLASLTITYCQLQGTVPASWGRLTNLTTLNVSHNSFTGLDQSFGNLSKLATLDLSYNSITGLPAEFGSLQNLQSANLSYNQLTSVPATIGALKKLTSLSLNNNLISGAVIKEMEGMTALTALYLQNNNFSDVQATFPATVTSFNINTQTITRDAFTYTGTDVRIDSLPRIMYYYRSGNTTNFDARNNFQVYLRGSNVATIVPAADGSFTIPASVLATLKTGDALYIYQTNGTAVYSRLNFNTTTVNMPPIPDTEYQALVDFYNAMNGNNWPASYRWDVSVNNLNTGAWYGISIENGHITGLNISINGNIAGTVPASISNLKYLKTFSLGSTNGWSCNLSATDLNVFAGLDSLTSLAMSNCQLQGNIPVSWGNLTSLTTLTLNNNNITGALPDEFGSLQNLTTLTLNNNNITGALPDEFGSLQNLQTVNLSYNQITSVPTTIGNLKKLTSLALNNNQITGAVIKEFDGMTALTTLHLENNHLSDIQATLPGTISYCNLNNQTIIWDVFNYTGTDVRIDSLPRLMYCYRSGNTMNFNTQYNFNIYLRGSNVATIVPAADGSFTIPASVLASLKTGDALYIYQNGGSYSQLNFTTVTVNLPPIPDSEYQALVDFFNSMNGNNWPATYRWDVSVNNLNQGAWPGVSITNGHITGLDISFSGNISGVVPASIGNLKYLKTFSLNPNGYSCNISATDLNVFAGLDSLTSLSLPSSQLKGNIPASWNSLTNLTTLTLNGNNITGFEPAFGSLPNLTTLTLNNNSITGLYPAIGGLSSLVTLNLSTNNISGSLSAQMSALTNLKTLNLNHNKLENVDKSLANLALTAVDFSYQTLNIPTVEITGNELSVDLPLYCTYANNAGVGSFGNKNTFILYINNVNVTNNYCTTDGTLTFKNLDQYGIKLTDQIKILQNGGVANQTTFNFAAVSFGSPLVDEEYEILKNFYAATNGDSWTQKWDTTQNNLNISSWYGVAIKNGHVVSIVLPSNNLSGSLPDNLGNLTQLETLDLQSNAITGSIPASIGALSSLKTLYLQANRLSGTIPLLSGITPLANLSLSGNLFSGTIPAQFNQFQNIGTLDLSNNSFDALETPFTYNLSRVYLNLRGQSIQKDEQLNYTADNISVDLPFINAYDDAARDYNGQNQFALQANGFTVASAVSNGKNLVFPDVNMTLIPQNAQISILQSSGAAKDAVIRYSGINDNSQTPVAEAEYNALVKLYQQTGGTQWTAPWNVAANNMNQVQWTGIAISDGHVISIDLSANNLQGTIPADLAQLTELRTLILKQNQLAGDIPPELASMPKLTTIDLSENELTGLSVAFSPAVNLNLSRQNIAMDSVKLIAGSLFSDNSINRYDQTAGTFGAQSYAVNIGSFNKTISIPSGGLNITSLMNQWNIPNNQTMTLQQIGGAARNSVLSYVINFTEGDANMDGAVNILDIQANINNILKQSQTYFNFGAGDLNADNNVNLLDIILLINKIQASAIQGSSAQANGGGAVLNIEDGILYLNNPDQKTGAFDIRLQGIEKSQIQDLAKQEGYTLSIAEKDGETGIIGYNSGNCLTGKIAIARVSGNAQIVDALVSDENAAAVSCTVDVPTGLNQTPNDGNKGTISNYPNPFAGNTVIKYYLPENASRVILKVFTPAGQTARIAEYPETSQGYHEIQFPQNNLAAGVYFYQIEVYTQGQLSTYRNKMIIK